MPKPHQEYQQMTCYTRTIVDFNSRVWNKKKETISEKTGKPLSLKDSIDISVPAKLQLFKKDLEMMHNLKNDNISNHVSE